MTRLGVGVGLITAIALGGIMGDNIIALATSIFFGLCAASFLPVFVGALFSKRMNRIAAIASVICGFTASLFWLLFMNSKTAVGVGLCAKLFQRPVLVPEGWSVTWTVVDPLIVALPISALVAIILTYAAKPMDPKYAHYCFGGAKPEDI